MAIYQDIDLSQLGWGRGEGLEALAIKADFGEAGYGVARIRHADHVLSRGANAMLRAEEQSEIRVRVAVQKVNCMAQMAIHAGRVGDQADSGFPEPTFRVFEQLLKTGAHEANLTRIRGDL